MRAATLASLLAICIVAHAEPIDARSVTQGRAQTQVASLFECPGGSLVRPTGIGTIKASDGTTWVVPAQVEFPTGRRAPDLYNECAKVTPTSLDQVKVEDIPVVTIDPDGEVITGYLIADNYFELYVNGVLVGIDAVPFTPFNSAIVRFRAKRPIVYAVKLVDWEENFGLGTEKGRSPFHPGDGGFLASFSDGTRTDQSWQAQSFYISPLASPDDVVEVGVVHDTPKLPATYPESPDDAACAERCFAVHYPLPARWMAPDFSTSQWPAAVEFTHAQMGVERLKAYTGFRDVFAGAKVIWSKNLVLDNVVIARKISK